MRYILMLALLVFASGCAKTTGVAAGSARGSAPEFVVFDSVGLERELEILSVRNVRDGEYLRGLALVQSLSEGDLNLQYQFYWYDAQGIELDQSAAPWRNLKLHGRQRLQIQAVAVNPQAISFKVYLRKIAD